MSPKDDEKMGVFSASHLFAGLYVYRCAGCALWRVEPGRVLGDFRHVGACRGKWEIMDAPFPRALVLAFLSREMLGKAQRTPRGYT